MYAGENYLKHSVSRLYSVLSVWNRIGGDVYRFPNVVDFFLQGEPIERRKRKREKQAEVSVEHSGSLTKSMLYLFWRSLDGGWVGDTPMRRHGLPRPQRTGLIRCVIADCEDEIKRGRIQRRELIHDSKST
jgi:hypothetical protein